MTRSRCVALIPAGGIGNRMQASIPKQYLPLAGRPMLQIVLETFAATAAIDHTYLVVACDDPYIDAMLDAMLDEKSDLKFDETRSSRRDPKLTVLRCGGASRRQTVLNGLIAMGAEVAASDWVLVHDAARPGLTSALIDRLIAEVGNDPVGGLLALPVADTVKRGEQLRAAQTLDRAALWLAQTPQMFRHELLLRALQSVPDCTDEASAVEALGLQPQLVEGSIFNFKVTRPDDAVLAALTIKGRQ